MTFEVLIEHDESPWVVDAEDWEFGPHGALMFYDADRNLVEVFRNWAHMTVNRERAGFWSRSSIPNPNYLAERDRQEQKVHEAMGVPRAMLGKDSTPDDQDKIDRGSQWVTEALCGTGEGQPTATEHRTKPNLTGRFPPNVKVSSEEMRERLDELDRRDTAGIYKDWHDPAIQALKDAWAELCDRGHDAAADTVFQMIQRRTGLEGLEYEVKRQEIPQTAPGKEYQSQTVPQDSPEGQKRIEDALKLAREHAVSMAGETDNRTETVDRLMRALPMGGFKDSECRAWREWLYGRSYVPMPKMEKARLRSFVNAMRDFIHDQARAVADLSEEIEQGQHDYKAAIERIKELEKNLEGRDNWLGNIADRRSKTIDATGGNADAELFQPGWSKMEFRGGPIHGHEGLLPAGVSMMLVVRGDHSYSYSLEPQGNVMAYVGAEALTGAPS